MKYSVLILLKAIVLAIINSSCENSEPIEKQKTIATKQKEEVQKPRFDPVLDSILYEAIEATGPLWLEGCHHFDGFDSTNTIVHSISPFLDETCYIVEFSGLCGQGNCGPNTYAFRHTEDTTEILLDICGWIDSISPVLHNGLLDVIISKRTYNDPSESGLRLCQFNGLKYDVTVIPLEKSLEEKIAEFLIEEIPDFNRIPSRYMAPKLNCIEVNLGIPSETSYMIYSEFTSYPILITSAYKDHFRLINNFNELGFSISVGPNILDNRTNGVRNLCFYRLEVYEYQPIIWRWNGTKYVPTGGDK